MPTTGYSLFIIITSWVFSVTKRTMSTAFFHTNPPSSLPHQVSPPRADLREPGAWPSRACNILVLLRPCPVVLRRAETGLPWPAPTWPSLAQEGLRNLRPEGRSRVYVPERRNPRRDRRSSAPVVVLLRPRRVLPVSMLGRVRKLSVFFLGFVLLLLCKLEWIAFSSENTLIWLAIHEHT